MTDVPGIGNRMTGQRAGRGGLDAGQAKREHDRVGDQGRRPEDGDRADKRRAGCDCRAEETQHRPPAITDTDQHGGDYHGGPGRRLRRGGHADGKPGKDMLGAPPQQRKAKAHQRQDRHVGAADRELEGDHRRRGDEQCPAHDMPCAGCRQREAEHDQERQAEPDPRVGDHRGAEQRARNAEQRHHGQVGVIGVRVMDRGECRRALVGRMVVNELASRPLDDAHFRLALAGGGVPEQRRDESTANTDQQGKIDTPCLPGQRRHGGHQVGAGGDRSPVPVQVVGAEQGDSGSEDRAHGENRGTPAPGDLDGRQPPGPPARSATLRSGDAQREHGH